MSIHHDGPWLDRMYNNRALVPEHPEHFRRWAADSAEAMRSHPRELDVRYGGGPNEHLDIFPAAQPDAPVLVFIHGGYWRALDKRDHSFVAPAFTREGVCVVIPNYALVPGSHDSADHDADWCRPWPGPGATSRATAAIRTASRWRAIPPAATWRR